MAKTKGADHIPGYCTLLFSIETAKGFLIVSQIHYICRVYFSKYDKNQYLIFVSMVS